MCASSPQMPAQLGAYKVRVKAKNCADWKAFGTLRLEISVGQAYHEGEKFAATLDWARHRFEKVVILLNDTLQRFNIMYEEGCREQEALIKSYHSGDAWLARVTPLLNSLPHCEVFRWDDWRASSDYSPNIKKACKLYHENEQFRLAVNASIDEVWARRHDPAGRKDAFFQHSTAYLLEETAAFGIIYKDIPGVSAYPGSFQELWNMFVDQDIPGAPEGLKHAYCLRIDFDRRNQKAAQQTDDKRSPMIRRLAGAA